MEIVKLSPSEEIVLQAIFDLQEQQEDVSIPDLIEHLRREYGKEYKRTTVVTFLQRMAAKDVVYTYRKGRISYAAPIYSKKAYRDFLVDELISGWYDGLKEDLVKELETI